MKKARLNGYRKKRRDLVNATVPEPDQPVSEVLLFPEPDLAIELPDQPVLDVVTNSEPVLEVVLNSEPVREVVLNSEAQEVVPVPDVPVPMPNVQKLRGPSGCGKKFRSINKLCVAEPSSGMKSGKKKQKK